MSTIKVNRIENTATTAGGINIDSSGRTGIGTTSPSSLLDCSGGNITLTEDTNIAFKNAAKDTNRGALQFTSGGEFRIRYGALLFEGLRTDSSGRLLVGTTTAGAYSNRRLTVATSSGTTALELRSATNGDSRIVFTDSTSSSDTGAYKGQILYDQTNDFMSFNTNGNNERLRITSDGKCGIATTSPAERLDVRRAGYGNVAFFADDSARGLFIKTTSDAAGLDSRNNLTALNFSIDGSEKARLDTSGKLLLGTTTGNHKLQVEASNAVAKFHNTNTGDNIGMIFQHARGLSGFAGKMVSMQRNDGTEVGSIVIGVSSTSFNTSSDYRLKENVVDIDGAINRVKQLTPRRFNFIDDADRIVDGFIAHEAQAVVPEAVSGTHNQVDDDGNAVMQGIDQSKLVPLLTAALQEAISKIETLETQHATLLARVTALEAA